MDEFYEQKCASCPYASEEDCFLCMRQLRKKISNGKSRRQDENKTELIIDIPEYVYSLYSQEYQMIG